MKKYAALFICCALALQLCGCAVSEGAPDNTGSDSEYSSSSSEPTSSEPESIPEKVYLNPADYLPSTADYVRQIIEEHVAKVEKPDMTEYEKVKAATDYIMSIGCYAASPALDVWRWRTAGDSVPTYEEMRALNMFIFGAETCEGYTAALNLILNEMGVETRYITGLTYLANGGLAYHSWSQVKVDGVWYHIDCDLDDNIAKNGMVTYKYFLKSDATMGRNHFWGQRLINLNQIEPGQVEEVRAHYMGEICPQDYPTPAANYIEPNEHPDIKEMREELKRELADYEDKYGKLEYMALDVVPPVFIRYFFDLDPADVREGWEDMQYFAKAYQNMRSVIQDTSIEKREDFEFPKATPTVWGVM